MSAAAARLRTRPVASLAWAALFAAAVVLGRATRLPGSPLALVWPAAAVGFLWLASRWGRPAARRLDALLLLVVAGVMNHATGAPVLLSTVLGVANVVQAVVTCAVMAALQQRRAAPSWRLRDPRDLSALVVAAVVGSLASSVIGPVGLALSSGSALLPAVGAWTLRNGASTFVFATVALRLADRDRSSTALTRGRVLELGAAAVAVAAAYTAVFGASVHLPVAFLLLPLSLWVALRFPTTVGATHVLLAGLFVVGLTLDGRGPFAVGAPATRVLLAQAYVAVAALVTLVLALQRDERDGLLVGLQQAREEAHEQAALLRTVIDTTSDGITVFDAAGHQVLRNPAAARILEPPTGLRARPEDGYRVRWPDGTPVPTGELPLSRALAGQDVPGVDLLVSTAARPGSRVLRMSAHPMPHAPGSPWSSGAVMAFRDVTDERAAAAETSRTRDLFAAMLDAATEIAIISCDPTGRITVFNTGAERMLGWTSGQVLGASPELFHDVAEVRDRARELGVAVGFEVFARTPRERGPETRQWTYLHRDGSVLQVLLTVSAMRTADGTLTGYMATASDITEQVAARVELAESEMRFRLAFDTAPVGMMLVGLAGPTASLVLRVNTTLCAFTGRTEAELLTLDMHALTHVDDQAECRVSFAPFLRGEVTEAQVEKRYQHADGTTRWGLLSATAVHPGHGQDPYLLCLIEDVTDRRAAQDALTHRALHDPLTGLPNRALFTDRLEHALADAARTGLRSGLVYVDLDGFKHVNDTAGHAAGDELLQQVGARLRQCLRPGDTLARLGGDEFAVLCPGSGGAVAVVAERLLDALRAPVVLTAGSYSISGSLGVTLTHLQDSAQSAVQRADLAMYEAKRGGKDQVRLDASTDAGSAAVPSQRSSSAGAVQRD